MYEYETSRWLCLTQAVPLKPGEQHCPYCRGHGYLPINKHEVGITRFTPPRCDVCGGTGKRS